MYYAIKENAIPNTYFPRTRTRYVELELDRTRTLAKQKQYIVPYEKNVQ